MKKLIVLVSLFLITSIVSVAAEGEKSAGFKDLPDTHWAAASVYKAAGKGIINGKPGNLFDPNANVTRAEFIKMVALAAEMEIPQQSGGKWFDPYVSVVAKEKIYNSSDFKSWTEPSTRLDMARLIVRALDPELRNASDKELMYEATKRGIIRGLDKGEIGGNEKSTRAQAAVIIDRMLSVKEGKTLEADKRAASYAEVEMSGTNLQTMWGMKAVPLPFKINAGSKLNVEIDQMLVVDLGDKEGAYREWFPKVMKQDGSTATKNEYVIALHLNVENTIKQASSSWSLPFKITTESPIYRYAGIHPDVKEQSPIKFVPTINTNKIQKIDGWYMMTIKKEDVENRPKIENGKFGIVIYNYVTRSKVFLSEKVDPR
ncbi:S-layer homology domain-containing protein [Cohnella sp. LGH]|uniref:S-layer homology domain-containing protein n=1 Tax=Cohnella sp. LGH TaxID=1619153 RepID=UPI001ADA9FD2|nr:S-layer homology domain-containing protein [Cohnella sp. LGH]QTH39887.1 S-layer homology domain-containing protein [Cohnella sp. LGH]